MLRTVLSASGYRDVGADTAEGSDHAHQSLQPSVNVVKPFGPPMVLSSIPTKPGLHAVPYTYTTGLLSLASRQTADPREQSLAQVGLQALFGYRSQGTGAQACGGGNADARVHY